MKKKKVVYISRPIHRMSEQICRSHCCHHLTWKVNEFQKNLQRYLPLVSHQQASNLPSSNGTFCNLHSSCISMREKVTIMIAPLKY
jgi:hypothetical protein